MSVNQLATKRNQFIWGMRILAWIAYRVPIQTAIILFVPTSHDTAGSVPTARSSVWSVQLPYPRFLPHSADPRRRQPLSLLANASLAYMGSASATPGITVALP
jgi:hypothetical protein